MTPAPHRTRFHPGQKPFHEASFPIYLVRDSDHIPNIETMMERHRVLRLGERVAWLDYVTVQRVPAGGFLLYCKLEDAAQMAHHPEYHGWISQALPLDDALGPGWRSISENEAREMLGDSTNA